MNNNLALFEEKEIRKIEKARYGLPFLLFYNIIWNIKCIAKERL